MLKTNQILTLRLRGSKISFDYRKGPSLQTQDLLKETCADRPFIIANICELNRIFIIKYSKLIKKSYKKPILFLMTLKICGSEVILSRSQGVKLLN